MSAIEYWYVDTKQEEEFAELVFVAHIPQSLLYAQIVLHDADGLEERSAKYWWKCVANEISVIESGGADTFAECEQAVIEMLTELAHEIAEAEDEEDD